MSKKEEKGKQESESFSDSAKMFDTLFKEAIPEEKEGKKTGHKEGESLSDSDELLVSVFKEHTEPGKDAPRRAKGAPLKDAPKKMPEQQEHPRKRETPDPGKAKVPAARRARETGPPPEVSKRLPQAKASSRWNPMRLGLVGLGVLLLAGGLWVYSGLFDSSPPKRPSPPPKPIARREIPQAPAPPKPEAKKGPVQVPPAGPPLQAKSQPTDSTVPEVSVPQVPKETLPAEAAPKVSKPPPPEADSAKPKAISYPYSVYLGSFRDRERLQKAVSIFQGKGLSPYWCRFDLGEKGVWFRVFAGHFRTREEADRFIREKGTEEAASKETRYAALIGTYGSKEELDREVSRLKGLGFGPYVIQDGEAAARLYVGAFYQESHAAEQVKELASKGIESRVVPR